MTTKHNDSVKSGQGISGAEGEDILRRQTVPFPTSRQYAARDIWARVKRANGPVKADDNMDGYSAPIPNDE